MSQRASRRRARQARVGPTPPPAGPPHPGAGPPRLEPTLPGSRGPVPATSSGHTVQCHCPPEARPASRSTPTSPRPVARLGPTRVSERSNVRLQSGGRGARQSQYNRDVDVAEWGGGSGGPGAVCGRTRSAGGGPTVPRHGRAWVAWRWETGGPGRGHPQCWVLGGAPVLSTGCQRVLGWAQAPTPWKGLRVAHWGTGGHTGRAPTHWQGPHPPLAPRLHLCQVSACPESCTRPPMLFPSLLAPSCFKADAPYSRQPWLCLD